jgi:DNA-binding winged helix-turn-helix (wHTH) protein
VEDQPSASGCLKFAEFELDELAGVLRRGGEPVHLPPQVWRVLVLLAGRAGELVSRDELHREVWGEATLVDFELGLNHCINRLRTILGDDPGRQRIIQTVPRRGYRFAAPVHRAPPGSGTVLAVLPFENLSRLAQDEYLADTITETLTHELGRRPALRVIPRQSVLHLEGSTLTLGAIARELGVEALVKGSTLRAQGRLLVTAALLAVEPERHLWSGSQEGYLGEPFAHFRRIARTMAAAIAHALGAEPDAPATGEAPPVDRHLTVDDEG